MIRQSFTDPMIWKDVYEAGLYNLEGGLLFISMQISMKNKIKSQAHTPISVFRLVASY
jgi:hypothetical protein